MITKPLTAARLRELLHYNKRTGVMTWIAAPRCHPRMRGKKAGSARHSRGGKYYVRVKVDGGNYSLSRLAFLWVNGVWPEYEVDHKNGDSLDNRWRNLREATHTQNTWNRKDNPARSLPMGVRSLPCGRFQARITKNKVQYCIGRFDSVTEAKSAYEAARRLAYGDFA